MARSALPTPAALLRNDIIVLNLVIVDLVMEGATQWRSDEYRLDESLTKLSAVPVLIRVQREADELVARFNERPGESAGNSPPEPPHWGGGRQVLDGGQLHAWQRAGGLPSGS